MYSRELEGKTYTFGVSGKLWRDALLMYDHQTRSLWSHITGEAIQGELKGKKLKPLVSMPQIAWKAWKENYPNTQVLSVQFRGVMRESISRDSYEGYHKSKVTGMSGTEYTDKRLDNKSLVIGVQVADEDGKIQYKAYPLKAFSDRSLIHDTINGVPLLILHDKETFATAVYNRTIDGRVENFIPNEDYTVEDSQGRHWNLVTGKLKSDEENNFSLDRMPAVNIYWFAWARYYPKTTIYRK